MFSKIEQEEIINEFLKVIDINDNKKLIKSDIETCRTCKINLPNTYLFKTFPTDIAKNICQYSFSECNGCKKVRTLLNYENENKIMVERLIKAIRDKQHLKFTPIPFREERTYFIFMLENEINYYFAKVNPYPTYQKIISKILKTENQRTVYSKNIHKELKKCYENHYQMKVEVGYGETLKFYHPITYWKGENINDDLLKILNQIMDYIDKNKNEKEIIKLANHNSEEKRLKECRMTDYFKTNFDKDEKPKVRKKKVPVYGWI